MFRAVVLASVTGLVAAPAAGAALTARLSLDTAHPWAKAPVTLTLRPYWPYSRSDGSCCRLEPADVDYPWRLQALGPRGSRVRFRAVKTADRFVWRARVLLPIGGPWEVRIENFYRSPRDAAAGVRYPNTAPRLVVRVQPR